MSKSLKASFGGKREYKKKNHYKLSDGDVVYRIIPPMTKYTDNPRDWIKFHSVHLGYKNMDGKMRGFESPLVEKYDRLTKIRTTVVADPALDRFNDLVDKLNKAREENNGPLMAKLNSLVGFKGVYNVDKNYHMNVIGLDGNIGELKIRGRAKADLDREIKRLEAEGVHPLSEEDGRFFVFHRDGLGTGTNFKVSVYTQKVTLPNGRTADEQVSHTITPELWNRIEEEAFDLNNLFSAPTAEEVAQIVAESNLLSGRSPACDRIFDERWKAKREANKAAGATAAPAEPQYEESQDDDAQQDNNGLVTNGATSGRVPVSNAGSTTVTTAVTQPTPILTPTQISAKTAPTTTQVAPEELSDDDFFKQIGIST